ncbi:SDR family oxidoreductase [Citricoccus sp. SGAir0253]|uniref:SDR family NAD(P)-dependent oxidoreductase n=1 Tax=Citricoccus sp. SGAir0253 TaxID=2567881 RepID=UPI0010CCF281|nr:SDR family oxidoreductase [Citricoccus sp. SGAir0253]QCU77227.1 SDR family oxidoreductase [Citricoccus sp. SGAir0253]
MAERLGERDVPQEWDVQHVPAPGETGQTILITGATSGLGAEFARQLAGQGHHLVITGRDPIALVGKAQGLEAQYGVSVDTLTADLATPEGVDVVAARLRSPDQPVTMLVNNAGAGLPTEFHESGAEDERRMLRLLVEAPMLLSHAAIQTFLARRGGRILNVASVAGLIPDGSYGAAKSWAVSFSRWANARYKPEGVTVTALCPGLVRTEFHQRAGIDTSRWPRWTWMDADDVVREGLTAAAEGRSVCVPSRRYRSLMTAARFSPDAVLERLSRTEPKSRRAGA